MDLVAGSHLVEVLGDSVCVPLYVCMLVPLFILSSIALADYKIIIGSTTFSGLSIFRTLNQAVLSCLTNYDNYRYQRRAPAAYPFALGMILLPGSFLYLPLSFIFSLPKGGYSSTLDLSFSCG